MKIICAWCEKAGVPAVLGEREPLDDPHDTHGICTGHFIEVLAAFRDKDVIASRPPAA